MPTRLLLSSRALSTLLSRTWTIRPPLLTLSLSHHLAPQPRQHRTQARHASPQHQSQSRPRRALVTSGITLVAALAVTYILFRPERQSATLNTKTFTPYTITVREPVSSSAVVLTVAPREPDPTPLHLVLPGGSSRRRHALWSVEFKQPEVQIARHYTPLPPSRLTVNDAHNHNGDKDGKGEHDNDVSSLRFYIRAVAGGEMSSYLARLPIGADVWLRGPHPTFDIASRLGTRGRHVVFLAGGTGIVPALQVAAAVLDDEASPETSMTLLWAVRSRDELQSGDYQMPPGRSWWKRWPWGTAQGALNPVHANLAQPSAIARTLVEAKARYGERLNIRIAIDEEGTAIRDADIEHALLHPPPSLPPLPSLPPPSSPSNGCPSHDQRLHAHASEFAGPEPTPCLCPVPTPRGGASSDDSSVAAAAAAAAGKNLLIVSGPNGFVAHFAGPKIWRRGALTQGPVGGVVARLQERHAGLADDWLVLKL